VSERTVANWVTGRTQINPAALAYLEEIEASADLRCKLGISEKVNGAPRGRPFAPGNPPIASGTAGGLCGWLGRRWREWSPRTIASSIAAIAPKQPLALRREFIHFRRSAVSPRATIVSQQRPLPARCSGGRSRLIAVIGTNGGFG
jgi:hypothetical protein